MAGVGGLGCPAALAVARAGVGLVGLVDPDVVDVSNLHRQLLYDEGDLGRPKVDAAADRLRAAAPGVELLTWPERFGAGHTALLDRFDLVIDGTDTIAAKFDVNDAAVAARRPLVHAGAIGFRAQLLTVLPEGSACFRCLFEEPPPPEDAPSCESAGVLGPVVALAGALQGAEAIRILSGAGAAFADRMLSFDLRDGVWRSTPLARNPRCAACGAPVTDAARRTA